MKRKNGTWQITKNKAFFACKRFYIGEKYIVKF